MLPYPTVPVIPSLLDVFKYYSYFILDQLVLQDLKKIRLKCWEARKKWMDIGIELNLDKSDLDALQDRYKENVDKCFTEMLDLWLRTNPRSMLADLIAALKERTVGFHQLAEELERESRKIVPTTPNQQYSKENVASFKNRKQHKICVSIFLAIAFFIEFLLNISAYTHIFPLYYNHDATGKGLELAVIGERAYAVLYTVKQSYTIENVTCELIHKSKLDCTVKNTRCNQYEISYQATSRGRHQLHIKVEGEHIKGSPFTVNAIRNFGSPIKIVTGIRSPHGISFNRWRDMIVAEHEFSNISIFYPSLKKKASYHFKDHRLGEYHKPINVATDAHDNILSTDREHHCILKFKQSGKFPEKIGKKGTNQLEFHAPFGIRMHPISKAVYVTEIYNHRVHILNHDLTFNSTLGSLGVGEGQFTKPRGIAFDSHGNVYVSDSAHLIQVFTSEGKYLRKFGRKGRYEGQLSEPWDIAIDNEDIIYVSEPENKRISVFTTEGKFLTSFGSKNNDIRHQIIDPRGIAVDWNGTVYVSDVYSSTILLF